MHIRDTCSCWNWVRSGFCRTLSLASLSSSPNHCAGVDLILDPAAVNRKLKVP